MKKYLTLGLFIVLVFSVGVVLAAKPDSTPHKANPSGGHPTVVIPAHAVEVAPGVFSLGRAIDKGRVVEGYAFIDYKKGFGKGKPGTDCGNGICEPGENARKCPADCSGNGGGEPDASNCYGFLSKGAKWRTIEPYIVNPANTRGLRGTFVTANIADDISKWETAAGVNILGGEITGLVNGADLQSPDNKNEVYFADIDSNGAIAITIVWGYFYGPPWQRELVEWDQVYDDVDFDWSADCSSEDCTGTDKMMDFENIATHELGHSVGLDDLYDGKCSEQTMYGYAGYGETKKRDLNTGDITGVRKLYS